MILFPAIDLIGGKVVRLERGDRSRCKVYSDDPVAVARSFAKRKIKGDMTPQTVKKSSTDFNVRPDTR